MHKIILSLASNLQQGQNLAEARIALGKVLSCISFTKELWTEPINASNPSMYLNQLAISSTDLTEDELTSVLKEIEVKMGRTKNLREKGIVPIDIDLLQYGHKKLHKHDWERPYVKQLLNDLYSFNTFER